MAYALPHNSIHPRVLVPGRPAESMWYQTTIEPPYRSRVPQAMIRSILLVPCFVLCHLAFAQDTLFPWQGNSHFGVRTFSTAADSAAFMQFIAGLDGREVTWDQEQPVLNWRLAWTESQHGGSWNVVRGDGSVVHQLREQPMGFALPMRTAEGKQGLVMIEEHPCAMICRNVRYYVEE